MQVAMDSFVEKHGFSDQNKGFPAKLPLNQGKLAAKVA
jgi:hypothetical protein